MKSHKQFCEELTNINPRISVLGRYTKATDPIEVKCNVCGKIWSPKAYSLLQGKGCHASFHIIGNGNVEIQAVA